MKVKYLLFLIILFSLISRFYMLGQLPAGIYPDEESHAYNAYSILKTGRDRYGAKFPILFRSFGSYQPPVLTYLTITPIIIFGNTIFAARFVNACLGVILVLITYLFTKKISKENQNSTFPIFASLVVAISPWSIFFSRLTAEGYLGLTLFVISVYFFILSLENRKYFPLGCLILGLATHAYYSERIISIIFLPIFIILYRKKLLKNNLHWILFGLVVFILMMIPHIMIASTGALTRRLTQVGIGYKKEFFSTLISKYIEYYSPRNLFFDTGASLGRITPEMGVYYNLLIIPFFFGLRFFTKYIDRKYLPLIILLVIISPIPAAMTGDSYYPLRALDNIWLFGLIISVGAHSIYRLLPKELGVIIILGVIISFTFSMFISYFVLFKYEKANEYINLTQVLDKYRDKQIIIDSTRDYGIGLRLAYLMKATPWSIQKQLKSQLKTAYYSGEVDINEVYRIGNIETRQFSFNDTCRSNTLIVGDTLTLSEEKATDEFKMTKEFEVMGLAGDVRLRAYLTNPSLKEGCLSK